MSSFATRRRAEEFAAAAEGRPARGAADARYDELLALVGALRAVPPPQPRAEFVTELRGRLVAEAATLSAREGAAGKRFRALTPDPGRVRSRRERRVGLALGGLALVGATTTLSVVAQAALPGDLLYPLKRGIESAHADLSVTDEGKGSTLLASASTRLDEIARLDPDEQATEIAGTLGDFTDQASEASDLLLASYAEEHDDSTVTELRDFTASSMRTLSGLEAQLPEDAHDEWVDAVMTVVAIDGEAQLACPTCGSDDLDELVPDLPTVGTGPVGSDPRLLPAAKLPDAGLPSLLIPSAAGDLPQGSATKPGQGSGPTGGAGDPAGQPTGEPTASPTPVFPTAGPSSEAALPTADVTQVQDDLTKNPLPLPSEGASQLLDGVATVVDDTLDNPLGGVLP